MIDQQPPCGGRGWRESQEFGQFQQRRERAGLLIRVETGRANGLAEFEGRDHEAGRSTGQDNQRGWVTALAVFDHTRSGRNSGRFGTFGYSPFDGGGSLFGADETGWVWSSDRTRSVRKRPRRGRIRGARLWGASPPGPAWEGLA